MPAFTAQTSATSNNSRNIYKIALILVFLFITACASLSSKGSDSGSVLIDSVRVKPADSHEITLTVPFSTLRQAQASVDLNSPMRVVKLVLSASQSGGEAIPQYRLFDVRKGSVGDVLGLQTADVLVAANGYLVYHPDQFKRYLMSIPVPSGTFIEIRRDGRPLVLRYKFPGMPAAEAPANVASRGKVLDEKADESKNLPGKLEATESPNMENKAALPELSPTPDNPVNLTKPASTPQAAPRKKTTPTPTASPSQKGKKKKDKAKHSSGDKEKKALSEE